MEGKMDAEFARRAFPELFNEPPKNAEEQEKLDALRRDILGAQQQLAELANPESDPAQQAFDEWWAEAQHVTEGRFVDAFMAGWEACLLATPSAYGVYQEIQREREHQDAQWGGPEHDDQHTGYDWLEFIEYQTGKINDPPSYREGLIKIAALAVAALESYDRKNKP